MRKLLLSAVMIFFAFSFKTNDYTLIYELKGNFSFVTNDAMGCVYVVEGSHLSKYNTQGQLLKTYSEKLYGNISSVDVSDPFKLLVYFNEFHKIVFLDNMLSPSGDPLSPESLGIQQSLLACSSYENGFWVFDQTENELVRFDKDLGISNKSGNTLLVTGTTVQPDFMIESEGYLFLNDTTQGIFIFDKFGSFYKLLPFKALPSFQINAENIFYFSKGKLISYNFKIFEEKVIDLPGENILSARYFNNHLLTQDATGIKIYSVK